MLSVSRVLLFTSIQLVLSNTNGQNIQLLPLQNTSLPSNLSAHSIDNPQFPTSLTSLTGVPFSNFPSPNQSIETTGLATDVTMNLQPQPYIGSQTPRSQSSQATAIHLFPEITSQSPPGNQTNSTLPNSPLPLINSLQPSLTTRSNSNPMINTQMMPNRNRLATESSMQVLNQTVNPISPSNTTAQPSVVSITQVPTSISSSSSNSMSVEDAWNVLFDNFTKSMPSNISQATWNEIMQGIETFAKPFTNQIKLLQNQDAQTSSTPDSNSIQSSQVVQSNQSQNQASQNQTGQGQVESVVNSLASMIPGFTSRRLNQLPSFPMSAAPVQRTNSIPQIANANANTSPIQSPQSPVASPGSSQAISNPMTIGNGPTPIGQNSPTPGSLASIQTIPGQVSSQGPGSSQNPSQTPVQSNQIQNPMQSSSPINIFPQQTPAPSQSTQAPSQMPIQTSQSPQANSPTQSQGPLDQNRPLNAASVQSATIPFPSPSPSQSPLLNGPRPN